MMYGWHGGAGWYWIWMVPMMLFWLVVVGAAVYLAVHVGNRDSQRRG